MEEQLSELQSLAARAENKRTETGIPRVAMVKGAVPEHQLTAIYEPMINLIVSGSKSMTIGGLSLHYNPATYFVMSVDLPAVGVVHSDASGAPYIGISLTLDAGTIVDLLGDLGSPSKPSGGASAFSVATLTPELLDAWVRLLRLMNHPADIPALAPVYEREILYRVLQGPMGWMLRDIAVADSALARINRAIQQIRRDYASPLKVEDIAGSVAMSVSAFHRHFKAVTTFSPLQYQKQLRLLQARTLVISSGHSITAAAHAVGYGSSTQFSREYSRAFGVAPSQDAARFAHAMRR